MMTPEELKTITKKALADAQHDFRIDSKRHYLDHMAIYLINVLIAIDQGINTIFFAGSPDETLSARAYRENSVCIR